MNVEIEVKFIDIDIDDIRKSLENAGAVCQQPMRLMRRALIEQPHHAAQHSFIRIRDEGDKITLTYKRRSDGQASDLHGVEELEVEVSNFLDTVKLFSEAGWQYKTFQESRRETWQLDDVEVVIDEWPWLEPFIEIEGDSEEALRAAAKKLGLDWAEAVVGHVDVVYEQKYRFKNGVRGVIDVREVGFGEPLPADFEAR